MANKVNLLTNFAVRICWICRIILVRNGARFKNKLMGVIFNLRKINTNQYYKSDSLNAGIVARYMNTWGYKTTNSYNYCTYLNRGLLEAPREYILHGLVPGLNRAPFWSHPIGMHLVAMPNTYLAVYCNGSSFTQVPSAIWVASH